MRRVVVTLTRKKEEAKAGKIPKTNVVYKTEEQRIESTFSFFRPYKFNELKQKNSVTSLLSAVSVQLE